MKKMKYISMSMHITKLAIIFPRSIEMKDKAFASYFQVPGIRKYGPSSWK